MDQRLDLDGLTGAVVVGDDGSADAGVAVRWARDDARRRGLPLVVIRAWSLTSAPRPATFEPGYVPSEEEFAAAVRAELLADLHETLGVDAGVELRPTPVHESAREALTAASAVAAVVVIASRGRGVAKALLGSTSEHVVREARGPVVVIPRTR